MGSFAPRVATTRKRVAEGASTAAPGPDDFAVRIELFVSMNESRCNADTPAASHAQRP